MLGIEVEVFSASQLMKHDAKIFKSRVLLDFPADCSIVFIKTVCRRHIEEIKIEGNKSVKRISHKTEFKVIGAVPSSNFPKYFASKEVYLFINIVGKAGMIDRAAGGFCYM